MPTLAVLQRLVPALQLPSLRERQEFNKEIDRKTLRAKLQKNQKSPLVRPLRSVSGEPPPSEAVARSATAVRSKP